ncbi:MAG: hypothetical protein ACP5HJ_01425 [Candidatus Micrarchaeia archaeon]
MRDISSFEIKAFLEETKEEMEGAFIKNFSQITPSRFRLEVYKEKRKFLLINFNPKLICLTKIVEEAQTPSSEVLRIRKILKGRRIEKVFQEGFERKIFFLCNGLRIIVDFTPNSNIFIETNEQRIKLFRKIEKNLKKEKQPKDKFFELFEKGVAPIYANEYLQRNEKEEIEKWFEEIIKKKEYFLFLENGKVKDYALTKIKKYENFSTRCYSSINSLLEEVYRQIIIEEKKVKEEEKEKKIEKLKSILLQQQEKIKELKEKEENYRKIGDYIFQHLDEINEIIQKAKKGEIKIVFDGKKKKLTIETNDQK